MAGKATVLRLLRQGRSYAEIAEELGISPGLAYLTATGIPADGGDTVTEAQRARPGLFRSRSQQLVNPGAHNPTVRTDVLAWVSRRAAEDTQMSAAGAANSEPAHEIRG